MSWDPETFPTVRNRVALPRKQLRQLNHQLKSTRLGSKYAVAEVFCPPRFTPEVEKMGLKGISFDVLNGWGLHRQGPIGIGLRKNLDWILQSFWLFVHHALTQGAGSTLTPCTCPVVKFWAADGSWRLSCCLSKTWSGNRWQQVVDFCLKHPAGVRCFGMMMKMQTLVSRVDILHHSHVLFSTFTCQLVEISRSGISVRAPGLLCSHPGHGSPPTPLPRRVSAWTCPCHYRRQWTGDRIHEQACWGDTPEIFVCAEHRAEVSFMHRSVSL